LGSVIGDVHKMMTFNRETKNMSGVKPPLALYSKRLKASSPEVQQEQQSRKDGKN